MNTKPRSPLLPTHPSVGTLKKRANESPVAPHANLVSELYDLGYSLVQIHAVLAQEHKVSVKFTAFRSWIKRHIAKRGRGFVAATQPPTALPFLPTPEQPVIAIESTIPIATNQLQGGFIQNLLHPTKPQTKDEMVASMNQLIASHESKTLLNPKRKSNV